MANPVLSCLAFLFFYPLLLLLNIFALILISAFFPIAFVIFIFVAIIVIIGLCFSLCCNPKLTYQNDLLLIER